MTRRITSVASLLGISAALVLCAFVQQARSAYPNGARIVSASSDRLEQGDDSTLLAAVSGDGRFVAFQTRARNLFAEDDPDPPGRYRVGGIFRKDLETGALALVADGDVRNESDSALVLRGAQNPSISADGRFVAFSTEQKLVPQDVNADIDVYVRDMDVQIGTPGAFDLVSAKDGGDTPASYALPGRSRGAEVTYSAALSADGLRVVFRTIGTLSDLPDRATADTPPNQAFVRDRATKRTILVTHKLDSSEQAGGATGPVGISGDGTTVVWTGENASLQTPFLQGETVDDSYDFFLWQRIADGGLAPTRRITGAVDLDDPGCPPSSSVTQDPNATGPCYGPLTLPENGGAGIASQLPAMSADGYRVAFLTGAGPRPNTSTGFGLDLYVTDMRPGVSRKAGTIELTREGVIGDPAASSPLAGISMSGDGQMVAFVTVRTRFVLTSPHLVGDPAALPDFFELYVLDLGAMEIERATRAFDGGEVNGDTGATVSVSGDGGRVAFTSTASNLFYGDSNDRPDAFVVSRAAESAPIEAIDSGFDPAGGPTEEGSPPRPRLRLRVRRATGGALRIDARVPGAGRIDARAIGRSSERPRAQRIRRARARTLARAGVRVRAAGRATVLLRLARRYRAALRAHRRIRAQLVCRFVPDGSVNPRLTVRRRVTFTAR